MIRILFLFIWFSGTLYAQSLEDKQAIEQILSNQIQAWNRADLKGFMREGYWQHDSLVFIGSTGYTYGWESVLHNYEKSYPTAVSMGKLHYSELQFSFLAKNVAFVIGRWTLTREVGPAEGAFSLTWKKIKGKWRIIADHSS